MVLAVIGNHTILTLVIWSLKAIIGRKRFTPMDEEILKEIVKKVSKFVRVVIR